ncbi:MAG: putative sugar nucleotidyl transferase [bacterium]|nr:putative sugar nucleotidyl transferase [bacterium]
MKRNFILFEDEHISSFLPLVWLNPFLNLRLGVSTLYEKWEKVLPQIDVLLVRDFLKDYTQFLFPHLKVNGSSFGICVFINSRLNPYQKLISTLLEVEPGEGCVDEEGVVLSFALEFPSNADISDIKELIQGVKVWKKVQGVELFRRLEDLINLNGIFITQDFLRFYDRFSFRIPVDVRILGDAVFISDEAQISPFVFIDATEGPVIIERNAVVSSFAYIEGPVYLGEGVLIKPFSKIFKNTTIGPVCKVGGEIESSIFHSYSNKQHDGFLGHSYVAPWVNIGADTVTSDLKNNYSTIRLRYRKQEWDTGSQFIGTIFGDHVKTGINTMLNSGTIVGVFTNIFGGGFHPKFIPSFFWGGGKEWQIHELGKAIETAKKMMRRRNVIPDETYLKLIEKVFWLSEVERKDFNL